MWLMSETPFMTRLEEVMREKYPQTPLLSDDFGRRYKIRTPDETYKILTNFITEQYQKGEITDLMFRHKLKGLRSLKEDCEYMRHSAYGIIQDIRLSFRTKWTDPRDYSRVVYTIEDVLTVISRV